MVARTLTRSPIPSSEDGGLQRPALQRPTTTTMNRRQRLVKMGSWMKYSWRKSKDSLMDGLDGDDNDGDNGIDNDRSFTPEAESRKPLPKHVHFTLDDTDGDHDDDFIPLVTEIINDDGDVENDTPPTYITEEEAMDSWYQSFDFQRFEKDRILTTMGYANARRQCKAFVEDEHSLRGIEHLCDDSLYLRQSGERKDLYKAVKAEEAKQKEEGTFPNLDRFRIVTIRHTKASKQRAMAKANEDAREQLREMMRSESMKNLFRRPRGRSSSLAKRRQSFG